MRRVVRVRVAMLSVLKAEPDCGRMSVSVYSWTEELDHGQNKGLRIEAWLVNSGLGRNVICFCTELRAGRLPESRVAIAISTFARSHVRELVVAWKTLP
jgi:hypothetical protein